MTDLEDALATALRACQRQLNIIAENLGVGFTCLEPTYTALGKYDAQYAIENSPWPCADCGKENPGDVRWCSCDP